MNRQWYIRGICKVAGLHKQAVWPAGSTTAAQQQPAYAAPVFDMDWVNQDIDQRISQFKQNPDANIQKQLADVYAWMQKNKIGNMPTIPFVDTSGARKDRGEYMAGTIKKLQQYFNSGQLTDAQRAEVQQYINLWQKQLHKNDTTAYRAIGPDGKIAWQSNRKAPPAREKQKPTYTRATTSAQHTDAKAAGTGAIMYGGDAAKVRKGYKDELNRIAKIKGAVQSDNYDTLVAQSSGALSPLRKHINNDSYQQAKETYDIQNLQAQEAQIQENMNNLGRSRAQVQQARRDGSDARAQKSYADLTQKAYDFINPKEQNTTTTAAPKPAAPAQVAPRPAHDVTPPVATPERTAPATAQPVTAATPGNTKLPPPVAQPAAGPATNTTQPQPTARPKPIRGMPAGTYDTTKATGRASYTRNGITYLQYDDATAAQNALGTNNVMAMTWDGKRYWAPINAKSTKSVGSYASTPGTVNNTRPKSPNIMRPSGMPGSKNGWKSAT